jgi:hypothetical protein
MSRWSLEMPESPTALLDELAKQEQLLNMLHEQVRCSKDHDKEEQLWEVQRVVTQLKRKVTAVDCSGVIITIAFIILQAACNLFTRADFLTLLK